MAWTSTELLADVRRSGMLPDSAPSGVSDTDILAHANKELQARLLPLVMAVREEFYVQPYSTPLVGNQQGYRVPARSIGNKLRDVLLQLSDGSLQNLARIAPEAYPEMMTTAPSVYPWAFYMESDSVMLVPTPSTTSAATLVLKYLLRPSWLVPVSASGTPTVTTVQANTPSSGLTRINHSATMDDLGGQKLDVVMAKPGFRTLMVGVTPVSSGAGYVVVNATDLPLDFSTANNAGDYLSAAETTPVVQLPPELHNLLYQRTLCRVLQSIGDLEALQAAEANAAQMEKDAIGIIANRVEGEPKKVVGRLLSRPRARVGRWF
jgi:hypothetical protein